MIELAKSSRKASLKLRSIDHETRKRILHRLADNLENRWQDVINENKKDMQAAEESQLNAALKDRLLLTEDRVIAMAKGVREIADQPEVVGATYQEFKNSAGLTIKRQRVPLGVILMIFESRPNVVIDCAALAIKSSNAIILKGGKEAKHSNQILGKIVQKALEPDLPIECVQTLASDKREEVQALLDLESYIDVVIPRGGERLIEHVYNNAKMPVIAHFKGLCHMYIDSEADLDKAKNLVINAKTQRTGVCNAIETLLVHKDILPQFASIVSKALMEKGTELRADKEFIQASNHEIKEAQTQDWATEYLENILSIKSVASIDEAIEHINEYGSFHTECIVSENTKAQEKFMASVDASCITINASTRFNDGGQLGLGAELGISTTKLHAYGPMGAEQMTTSRYIVVGDGQIRE